MSEHKKLQDFFSDCPLPKCEEVMNFLFFIGGLLSITLFFFFLRYKISTKSSITKIFLTLKPIYQEKIMLILQNIDNEDFFPKEKQKFANNPKPDEVIIKDAIIINDEIANFGKINDSEQISNREKIHTPKTNLISVRDLPEITNFGKT